MKSLQSKAGVMILMILTFVFSTQGFAQSLKTQRGQNPTQSNTQLAQSNTHFSENKPNEASDNVSPFDAVKGKREDKTKRDAFSKHYINEDGSFTALIGAGPIHFEKNGQFLDIDHTITSNFDSHYNYSNTTNLLESYFGATAQVGIKNKTAEGEIKEFLNTKMFWEVNGQNIGTLNSANSPVSIQNDKAYYPNIYGNISAEFQILTGKRKLNYIIPNAQALGNVPTGADFLVFSEDVILPFGWTSTITENGVLIKDQLGKEIYLYENPVSTDAAVDELSAQGNTIFETHQIGNTLTIKTKVKTAWLLSSARQFPVMVDPTVNVYPNNATRWTKSVYSNGTEVATSLYFGYQSSMFLNAHIRFNTSSIADGSIITGATGYINLTAGTGTNPATRQWQFANSANPVTTTGTSLYNSANLGYSNPVTVTGTGWRNSVLYNPQGNTYVENSLVNGAVNLAAVSYGNYTNGTYMTLANYTSTNRPYLVINYLHALNVTNAFSGATYADGRHGFETNTSVTVTSGTRPGYVCTGWTGTGNVPATGTGNSVTITMTQNSSINWLWAIQPQANNLKFHNYGGTDQLTFNNSRINTTSPVFRLSHGSEAANGYEIQISTDPTFVVGTSWTQSFTGTYPVNTETNFTFNNAFAPTNNTTYYVRARAKATVNNVWSAWTTQTQSFTFHNAQNVPDWFQTTQTQFNSDVLSGVQSTTNHTIVPVSGGSVITNSSFEPNLNGWTIVKPSWYTVASEAYGNTLGTNALNIYNSNPSSFGNFNGDHAGVYQTVNMTGVSTILVDFGYDSTSGSNLNVNFEIYISETSQTGIRVGTKVEDWRPLQNVTLGNARSIDVSSYNFTGNKLIKIVAYHAIPSTDYAERYFYIDNLRTVSPPKGTITSTPIHLASVQGTSGFAGITWNQTLGGGSLKLDVQQSADGISGWTNVAGYAGITATGDGAKTFDLTSMYPYSHIRLVGQLDGANVVMQDWSVQFKVEEIDCASETKWTSNGWSNGVPNGSGAKMKIIFEGNYDSSTDPNYPIDTGLVGCTVEVKGNAAVIIAAGHSLTIDDEIVVENANGATFTVKSDANLVQKNAGVNNVGKIKVERIAFVPSIQYNYWASPVKEQLLYDIYNVPTNRVMTYNTWNNYFTILPKNTNPKSQFGIGYSIKGPATNYPQNQNGTTEVKATFEGVPQNESGDEDGNKITLSKEGSGFNLIGNPFPSNLNLNSVYNFGTNKDVFTGTYYFWDNTNNEELTQQGSGYQGNNYAIFNANSGGVEATGGDTMKKPNGIVKPGQGFIVKAIQTDTAPNQIILNNGMRTKEVKMNGTGDDAVYYKNGGEPATDSHKRIDKFWLEMMTPDEIYVQILVGYFPGADTAFDKFDSKIMSESVSDNLYSFSKDDVKLAIQGKPAPFTVEDVVPLGIKAFKSGKYKIKLEDRIGIFVQHQKIYLKDKMLNSIHDLTLADYDFETESGVFNDRFEIVYKDGSTPSGPVLTTASQSQLKIQKKDNHIEISSTLDKILEVEIFNLSGWSLYKNAQVNKNLIAIPADRFGKQILVVKVQTETGEIKSQKLLVK